ncbi:DUF397 domain-containing protein [Streptomyces sp. HB-N217]|uniref:DUF397 domain-containing protein n=1 Tax=Streptomyces TaxID=1883 RepID=UPI0018DA0E8D|nr:MULTISPECIES: DUF397 domain-containing protein [Streptomyces]MBH5129929.1 DUF397 domain-containing protein [Streptomyces sp. HB-N217]
MSIHQWRKSPYGGDGSNRLGTATTPARVLVRDSKDPNGPRLAPRPATWTRSAACTAADAHGRSRGARP